MNRYSMTPTSPRRRGGGAWSSPTSHSSLPAHTVEYLKQWIMSPEHVTHPYPTEQEKKQIMSDTGIELKQLNNWFVNNRKRYWKPLVEAKGLTTATLPTLPPIDIDDNDAASLEDTANDEPPPKKKKPKKFGIKPVTVMPQFIIAANDDKLRDADVLASKISYSRGHPGNVFYRDIIENYSQQLYNKGYSKNIIASKSDQENRLTRRIYEIITGDRQGRFLKQTPDGVWHEMKEPEVIRKIALALKSSQYKVGGPKAGARNPAARPTKRKKKTNIVRRRTIVTHRPVVIKKQRKQYQAQPGSNNSTDHAYVFQIMTRICNVPDTDQALSLLDNSMKQITSNATPTAQQQDAEEKESGQERSQRLQLRHRYIAAWDGGMSHIEFSKRLLEFWGGSLIETTISEQPTSGETSSALVKDTTLPTAEPRQEQPQLQAQNAVVSQSCASSPQSCIESTVVAPTEGSRR